jgi:signal transduction histidine kinase
LAEVVGQLVIESNRASNVVRRLRNLCGSGSTSLTHFPLLEFLQSVADDFRRLDAEGLVEVRVMPPIPALNLYADRVQMEILFRNLFANARDAVRCAAVPDGRIELSAHLVNDRTLRIRVQDNGPGISSELSDRIFNPFVSSKSSGLGLGLAICREVATVHGGKLVHIPGAHGCFELELPIEHSMNTQ